ncbi:DUF5819 family protein [Streptomyces roseoverticillatus]|uniref:DUF5819 family protein n=1 Tax=Streptomyces roseoverticillatus TaxID=66429 RepID=A0ABV3IW00_9ACTN
MSSTDYNRAGNGSVPVEDEGLVPELPITATGPAVADVEETGCEGPASPVPMSRPAGLVIAFAAAACVATVIVHVSMVFLSVAPPNTVSQRYEGRISTWVYPYFEQNWRLFAPDPEGARRRVLARTATTSPDGARQVSGWIDLSAIDASAVRHNAFPSHINQNMLRRAWSAYLDSHGTSDQSDSDRARIIQRYLLNIAAQRAARSHRSFDAIQLRVITTPIASPVRRADGSRSPQPSSDSRYLPWWQVTSHDD